MLKIKFVQKILIKGQVRSEKGELYRGFGFYLGSGFYLDFFIGVSYGVDVMCWFVIFNFFNYLSQVLFFRFILFREGKNFISLFEGKNVLLVLSKLEWRFSLFVYKVCIFFVELLCFL